VYHAFWGEPSIGVLAFMIGGSLIANAFEAKRNEDMLVSPEILFILVTLATVIGFQTLGLNMAFWCYPVPLFFLFAVEWRKANLLAAAWLIFVAICGSLYVPSENALRIVVTLAITTIVGWLFVALIRRLQDELSKLASHDPMTGALNRGQVLQGLNIARERAARGQEVSSIVMVDIDHFKSVNDTFGHQAGDKVIRQVVETFKNRLRKLDQIFRYGGEEFLILLSAASAVDGLRVCEQLRELIEDSIQIGERTITASFGLAEIVAAEPIEEWIARADKALYEAKETGRNRVCVAPSGELHHAPRDGLTFGTLTSHIEKP
jgi:diguanylate cyclase (GGDEF)-like protein